MELMELKEGDVVTLKSDDIRMTIVRINESTKECLCVYRSTDDRICKDYVMLNALTKKLIKT